MVRVELLKNAKVLFFKIVLLTTETESFMSPSGPKDSERGAQKPERKQGGGYNKNPPPKPLSQGVLWTRGGKAWCLGILVHLRTKS